MRGRPVASEVHSFHQHVRAHDGVARQVEHRGVVARPEKDAVALWKARQQGREQAELPGVGEALGWRHESRL